MLGVEREVAQMHKMQKNNLIVKLDIREDICSFTQGNSRTLAPNVTNHLIKLVIHSGEKSHKCSECINSFSQAGNLSGGRFTCTPTVEKDYDISI